MNARRLKKTFDFFLVDNVHIIISLFFIALTATFVYRNSFSVPFLFDDYPQIVFNPAIQSWNFWENTRRPLLYASLAFNFHFDHLQTFGYHAFNLRVHMLSAMALFLLIYKTSGLPNIPEIIRRDKLLIALGTSLLWLCHPLQTQAVTYIIQRAESMMALFFIVTLIFCAQYFETKKSVWWVLAGISSLLCGLTKEVALALPVVVLLYDRTFISKSFQEALKKHQRLYLALSGMWIVMIYLFFTTPPEAIPSAGFAIKDLSPLTYAANQPGVILHYLRLVIWPNPLIFDYNWPAATNLAKLVIPASLVVTGIYALITNFKHSPRICFLVLSFFVILAPSSSFIALKDLVYEYRIYLALSPLIVLGVVALRSKIKRKEFFITIVAVFVLILGGITNQRNIIYQNEETLWLDVLKKQPDNLRVLSNLGSYYFRIDRYKKAEQYYRKYLNLNSDSPEVLSNLALALAAQKKFDEAIVYGKKSLEISPDFSAGRHNLDVINQIMARENKKSLNNK